MTYKKIYLLCFCLISLIGCGNSQNNKSDKNFKNYFFQPEWFETPMVYEYEFFSKSTGEKRNVYRYFEKIDDNKLKHIIYNKDFNQTVIIIYEYLPDKVIFKEITTVETWNNNRHIHEKFTDNVVFDYYKMNKDFGFTQTDRIENYSNVTKYVTRNLKKTEKREFNGKEVNVVIADGITNIDIKTNLENIKIHNIEKLIYAENIGVIYQESNNQFNEAISNLTRIMSKDEFERLKNAR